MKLLFIRHAEAAELDTWPGDDMDRPLTRDGVKTARAMCRLLASRGIAADILFTSEALRARQTAECFRKIARRTKATCLLNPGCTRDDVIQLVSDNPRARLIAVAGHEPDFSTIIAALIGAPRAHIKLKKGACALIDLDDQLRGELCWLIPPAPAKKGIHG